MSEPLSPEALAEIRETAGQPVRDHLDVAVLVRQRALLIAEVGRLTSERDRFASGLAANRAMYEQAQVLCSEYLTEIGRQSALARKAETERDRAVAAELRRLAQQTRSIYQQLPEYTHGGLAWRLLETLDQRATELERPDQDPGKHDSCNGDL